ncbi:MAG: cupin [Myxococcales bacterium]|nr:cupin [Myxococcales bacterium]
MTAATTPSGRTEPVRIDKPWGYELLWAHTERYVGKILVIHAGHALSLQYHQRKEETLMVLSGEVSIEFFAESEPPSIEQFTRHQILHVPAGLRHRLTALTDAELAEVSTPELDDVVRITDRYGRGAAP